MAGTYSTYFFFSLKNYQHTSKCYHCSFIIDQLNEFADGLEEMVGEICFGSWGSTW